MIDGRVASLLKSIALEDQPYDLFDSLTPEDKAYNRGYVDGYEEFSKTIKQRVMEDKTPEFFDTIISKENAYKEGYVIGYIEGLKSDRCKWIPYTQNTKPEVEQMYWITVKDKYDSYDSHVTSDFYSKKYGGFWSYVDNMVTAYMPYNKPEPYKKRGKYNGSKMGTLLNGMQTQNGCFP